MRELLLILILFVSLPAFGQEKFRAICQNSLTYGEAFAKDIKWLKHHYKTTDCQEIINELSKLKSFSEFMVPQEMHSERYYTWAEDFPYLVGLSKDLNVAWMPWSLGLDYDEANIFIHPEMYSEFKNLTVLDISILFPYDTIDLCTIRKNLPYVETLIVDRIHVYLMEKRCKDLSSVPWLIVNDMNGLTIPKYLHTKVVGILGFAGSLQLLKNFRFLRYLGINNHTDSNDVGYLGKNLNLTHLVLNMRTGVKNLSELRQLKNLKALTITCTIPTTYVTMNILQGEPCAKSSLTDLSFLLELPWLEKLVLPANRLEQVTVISKLKNLTHLDLSHNNITVMPDLTALKNLTHFNISKNPVKP